MHGEGGMHSEIRVCLGKGGMLGKGGHAWQRGVVWQRGCAWQGCIYGIRRDTECILVTKAMTTKQCILTNNSIYFYSPCLSFCFIC